MDNGKPATSGETDNRWERVPNMAKTVFGIFSWHRSDAPAMFDQTQGCNAMPCRYGPNKICLCKKA